MKTTMVFGTFDIFHPGHVYFLKQAKKYGDYLIVVVARDETVKKVKKKNPQNNELTRVDAIKNSHLADKVVLGGTGNKFAVIQRYEPQVICLGYDQSFFTDKLREKLDQFDLKKTKIIRLKSFKPEIYKSSKLINAFSESNKSKEKDPRGQID